MNTTTGTITTTELLNQLNAFDGRNEDGLNWWDDVAAAHADLDATNAEYGENSNDGFVAITADGLRRIEYTGGEWQDMGTHGAH